MTASNLSVDQHRSASVPSGGPIRLISEMASEIGSPPSAPALGDATTPGCLTNLTSEHGKKCPRTETSFGRWG